MKCTLNQAWEEAFVCPFLPQRYCTRFLATYKGRFVPKRCGNRWETQLPLSCIRRKIQPQLFTDTIITTEYFKNLENYEACCCDERCESVESLETPIDYSIYGVDLHVALCENRGKQSLTQLVRREIQNLVHCLQHIFRTFLKSSPQGVNTESRKHQNSQVFDCHERSARKRRRESQLAFPSAVRGKSQRLTATRPLDA